MKIRSWEDGDDFGVQGGLFAELGEQDNSIGVRLPSGHVVTVFGDAIYVREPGQSRFVSGLKIWNVHKGAELLEPCPECGRPVGRTRSGKVREHCTVVVHESGGRSYPTCPGARTLRAES